MSKDKNIKDSLPLPTQIAALQVEYDQLSNLRDHTVDVQEFDRISKRMVEVHKRITLKTNQIRLLSEAEIAAARAAAILQHQERKEKIAELKAELEKRDQILFSALEIFYNQVLKHYDAVAELQELSVTAAGEAKSLGVDPVLLPGMSRLGVIWQEKPEKISAELVRVFHDQFWQASDARKNGVDVRPDFPSVASLSTVGRIHDWTPWLKSEFKPPPDPDIDPDIPDEAPPDPVQP